MWCGHGCDQRAPHTPGWAGGRRDHLRPGDTSEYDPQKWVAKFFFKWVCQRHRKEEKSRGPLRGLFLKQPPPLPPQGKTLCFQTTSRIIILFFCSTSCRPSTSPTWLRATTPPRRRRPRHPTSSPASCARSGPASRDTWSPSKDPLLLPPPSHPSLCQQPLMNQDTEHLCSRILSHI